MIHYANGGAMPTYLTSDCCEETKVADANMQRVSRKWIDVKRLPRHEPNSNEERLA